MSGGTDQLANQRRHARDRPALTHPPTPSFTTQPDSPIERICAVLLTQRFPNDDIDLRKKFPQLVMQAVI